MKEVIGAREFLQALEQHSQESSGQGLDEASNPTRVQGVFHFYLVSD